MSERNEVDVNRLVRCRKGHEAECDSMKPVGCPDCDNGTQIWGTSCDEYLRECPTCKGSRKIYSSNFNF